jgi:hypothetical protein
LLPFSLLSHYVIQELADEMQSPLDYLHYTSSDSNDTIQQTNMPGNLTNYYYYYYYYYCAPPISVLTLNKPLSQQQKMKSK